MCQTFSRAWRPEAKYDPFTLEGRQQIRADPYTGTIAGVSDFTVPLVLDPLNFVGAPGKGVYALGKGAKLVSEADEPGRGIFARKGLASPTKFAESLENGHYADTVSFIGREEDDIAGQLAWAANSRMGINDPASFAHLANTVKGKEDATHLLNVLVGTPDAEVSAKILSERLRPRLRTDRGEPRRLDRPWQRRWPPAATSSLARTWTCSRDRRLMTAVDGSENGKRVVRTRRSRSPRG